MCKFLSGLVTIAKHPKILCLDLMHHDATIKALGIKEAEAKVKGDQSTDNRSMKWSFRFGTKRHGNREILDTYYIGMRRDRTDFKKTRWSWLLSTAWEYRIDFDHRDFHPVMYYLMAEKNWPVGKRKWVLSVGAGYLRRDASNYLGGLAVRHGPTEEQFLLRPNLKF